MTQIYIHIGFHKTGSTWLQNKVFLNKDSFNLLNDHEKPWDDKLIDYIIYTPFKDFDKNILFEIVKSRFDEEKINIISAERLSGHPVSKGFDSESIAQKLYKAFPEAKIIIVTREEYSFKYSCYKQLIKRGFTDDFNSYVNSNSWFFPVNSKLYFDHTHLTRVYKNLFGNTNVLQLEFGMFKENKSKFLELLSKLFNSNIRVKEIDKKSIINETFSNSRIRAIRFLNQLRKSQHNKSPNFKLLNRKSVFILSKFLSFFFSNKKF